MATKKKKVVSSYTTTSGQKVVKYSDGSKTYDGKPSSSSGSSSSSKSSSSSSSSSGKSSSSGSSSSSSSGPQTVTVEKDGVRTTVTETTPGLFGKLGYTYVDGGGSSSAAPASSGPSDALKNLSIASAQGKTVTQEDINSGALKSGGKFDSGGKSDLQNLSIALAEQNVQNEQAPVEEGLLEQGGDAVGTGQSVDNQITNQQVAAGGLPSSQLESQTQTTALNPAGEFVSFSTPTGKAYFRQTEQGLAAVNQPEIIRGLQTGSIPSTDAKSYPTAGNAFTPTLSSEAGVSRTTPDSNVATYGAYQNMFGLPSIEEGFAQFNANPLGSIQEITTQILDQLGLGDANKEIESISDELEDLENDRDDELRDINDDPWLTEGVRLRQRQKVEEKYEDKINNRVNKLQLLESVRDDARQNAQFALGTAISLWDSERRFQQQQVEFYYTQAQNQFENQYKMQQLALAEAAAAKPDTTADLTEYMAAVEAGQFTGSFLSWKSSVASATRAPSAGGGYSDQLYAGLSPATATAVRSMVNKFGSEPLVQNFGTIQDGYLFTKSIKTDTKNPADDQALIYSLAKTLDPGSVVREGEYATAQKYAQSWVNAYGKGVTQAIAGTGFLSQAARENIKQVIESKYNSSAQSYNNLQNQYTNRINNLTGRDNASAFLIDYTTPQAQEPVYLGPVAPAQAFDEVVATSSSGGGGFFSNFLNGLFGR